MRVMFFVVELTPCFSTRQHCHETDLLARDSPEGPAVWLLLYSASTPAAQPKRTTLFFSGHYPLLVLNYSEFFFPQNNVLWEILDSVFEATRSEHQTPNFWIPTSCLKIQQLFHKQLLCFHSGRERGRDWERERQNLLQLPGKNKVVDDIQSDWLPPSGGCSALSCVQPAHEIMTQLQSNFKYTQVKLIVMSVILQ